MLLDIFYRQIAIDNLLRLAEQKNVTLTRVFANLSWPQFKPFINNMPDLTNGQLRTHPEIIKLHQALMTQISGTDIVRVKLYNLEGLTIFSTDFSQIGQDQSDNPGFVAAKNGQITSHLTYRNEFNSFDGVIENRDLLVSYLPIRNETGTIEAVFELYSDLTPLLAQIKRTERSALGGAILLMVGTYLTLFFIVRYANQIIQRQYGEREEAQIALRVSEAKYRQLVQHAPAGLYVYDLAQRRMVEVNDVMCERTGYSREELLSLNSSDLLTEDSRQIALERLQRMMAGEPVPETVEYRVVRKDGQILEALVNVKLLQDEHGKLGKVAAVVHDITEQKQMEQARQESEARYRRMFENVQDIYYELTVDGTIVDISPSVERVSKYKPEELIGSSAYNLYIKPAQRDETFTALQENGLINDYEILLRDKDGQPVPCSFTAKMIYDPQGTPWRVIGTIRNITDRKRAQEALQQAHNELEAKVAARTAELTAANRQLQQEIQERQRAEEALRQLKDFNEGIVQSMSEGIVMEDSEGYFTFVNPAAAALLGYDPLTLIGQHWTVIVPPDQQPIIAAADQRRAHGEADHYEVELLHRNGMRIPVLISGAPRFEVELDDFVGTLASFTDITARKQSEEQLKVSLQEKEILLQEIHHRVKNNLQVISSLLSLQSNYVGDPDIIEVFHDSQNRIRSMALVHEKLYQSPDLAQIDFAEYIQSLASYLFRAHGANGRGITLRLNTERIFLGIDTAVPCGLIINELISNALKHAFPNNTDGTISVGLGKDENKSIVLTVDDNGVGFPPGLDFRRTTSLGLQLVNSLVNQIDATIEQNNKNGAAFKITFSV
jgi:PAS domain S-box-containing protein